MKLLSLLIATLFGLLLLTRVRRAVAFTLVGVIAFTAVAPPAKAQLGIPAVVAAAAQVVATINNLIRPLLNTINTTFGAINRVLGQFRTLWDQIVYPLNLINQARALVNSMIAQFRGPLAGLMRVNVASAQLANPMALEGSIRNRSTGDFAQLTNAFRQTYRTIPQPADAHPMERDLADIDDAMALSNLKTLKASDAMVDQMMAAGDTIENEGLVMAPGSAPYLAGTGITAAVRSQAITNVIGSGLQAISGALNAVNGLLTAIQSYFQNTIYPQVAIDRARGVVGAVRGIYNSIRSLANLNVASATLANPRQLEAVLLSRSAGSIGQVTGSFARVYQAVPPATDAPAPMRDLIDMTDATAQAALKKSIAIDDAADRLMDASDQLAAEMAAAAPGTAPMVEAQAAAMLVKAHALTQSAMAEMFRIRAIDMANTGASLKFNANHASDTRRDFTNMFKK